MPTQGTWLECNGQSTSAYPALRAVVGNNVPDYRGYFLRGYGGNSASLGTAQSDAIRNITGTTPIISGGYYNDNNSGAFVRHSSQTQPHINAGLAGVSSSLFFDASRVVPTANENRPVNKAVRYLIKAA